MKGKTKSRLKMAIDVCMTVLLLCLMAYQVTGETLHEWFGIGMTVLLIVHHILNRQWYGALFRGKYNAYRIVTTLVNTLLLASIALTAMCGMAMSNHAVPFLYGFLPVSFARRFHLAMSFWSFLLMGFHLGLHLPAMTAKAKPGNFSKALLTVIFTCVAGLGLGIFLKNDIPDYIFFRTPFAFLDYSKAGWIVFLENLASLFFFSFLGALLGRGIVRFEHTKRIRSIMFSTFWKPNARRMRSLIMLLMASTRALLTRIAMVFRM